ncbi:MAG TPA: STAS domain-containing protein [Rectinemataceae bacterium]|nr:STAS domain-containing protein [Rectinemataceae bacterium]
MDEALFFKAVDDRIFIKAKGHVTAAFCPELKSRCFARFEDKPPVASILLDLTECDYMDSTFLGLIVGLAKRLKTVSGRKIALWGVSDICVGLLRTIGVLRLVDIASVAPVLPPSLDQVGRGVTTTAQFLLDSHEELSSLSDENRAKFSALSSMLRESIKKPGGEDSR